MKNKLIVIALSAFAFIQFNCAKTKTANLNENSDNYKKELRQELAQYYAHAKLCTTEYEVKVFINKLPIVRESNVKEIGGEKNWQDFLNWLKENGDQKITFTNQGVPIFKRGRSPWGH
jgi:hypothetical protein